MPEMEFDSFSPAACPVLVVACVGLPPCGLALAAGASSLGSVLASELGEGVRGPGAGSRVGAQARAPARAAHNVMVAEFCLRDILEWSPFIWNLVEARSGAVR